MPSVSHSLVVLTGVWIVLDFSVLCLLTLAMRRLVTARLQRRLLQVSAVMLLLVGLGGLVLALRELLAL